MIVLSHVTNLLRDDIGEIRVYNSTGLFHTKTLTNIEAITSTKYKIEIYFDQNEANTDITDIKVFSKSGEEIASTFYNKTKNQNKTLLIYWYMEVK